MTTSGSRTYGDQYYGAREAAPETRRQSLLGIGGRRR
jgi:hypothetical protein